MNVRALRDPPPMPEAPPMPPHSVEAEQAVVGALLLDNDAWARVAGIIGEPDFYRADHRAVWRAAASLIEAGAAADVVTVGAALEASRELDQCGGLGYLVSLAQNTPSAANAGHYAGIVAEKAKRRALAALGNRLADAATGAEPLADLAAKAADELAGLAVSKQAAIWPSGTGEIGQFLDSPPPERAWFVSERLLQGRAHLLTGIGGSSKTTLLVQLGIAAVIGRTSWGWEVPNTGRAVLLLAEDTEKDFHRTLAGMAHDLALTDSERADLVKRLRVFPMASKDARLLTIGPRGLAESTSGAGFVTLCQSMPGLAFIGLDPALALSDGDELNPAHQRRLGEFADRLAINTGASVILTSHAAKGLQSSDEIGSHSSRGSGALTDVVRAEYVLRTMTSAEARGFGLSNEERMFYAQLVAAKANALPPSAKAPLWLRRGAGGVLHAADLLPVEGEAQALQRRDTEALAVLRELSGTSAATFTDWREECTKRGIIRTTSPDAQKKAMQRIQSALLAHGLITKGVGRGVLLPVGDE